MRSLLTFEPLLLQPAGWVVRTEQREGEYITCFFLEEPKAAGALHSSSHPFTPTFGLCCLSGGASPDPMIRLPEWHIPCLLLGPLLSGWGCKFYAGHLLPLHDLFQLPGIFHRECPRKEATTFVPGAWKGWTQLSARKDHPTPTTLLPPILPWF